MKYKLILLTLILFATDLSYSTDINYIEKITPKGTYLNLANNLYVSSSNVGIGTSSPGQKLDVSGGNIRTTGQLISTVATGTAPLSVSSTTLVTNLNADLLDGQQGSYYDQRQYTRADNYLGGYYVSGGTEKPNNAIFGAGKLKLAMLSGSNLGFGGTWNDVLWLSSYTGVDVKSSHALVFDKYSNNVYVSDQNFDSASWGTGYKVWHAGSDGSGSGLDADLLDGHDSSYFQTALTNPVTGTGTANYITKWTGSTSVGNSVIYESGGKIGIGTTNPLNIININYDSYSQSYPAWITDGSSKGMFITAGSDNAFFGVKNVGGGVEGNDWNTAIYFGNEVADDLEIHSYNGEVARVTGDGNVGIGTTSPGAKLDVRGGDSFFTQKIVSEAVSPGSLLLVKNYAKTPHPETEVLSDYDGYPTVYKVVSIGGCCEDFSTGQYYSGADTGVWWYMSFLAKWSEPFDWEGHEDINEWILKPTPDNTTYQRYILRSKDTDGVNEELFRLYYNANEGTAYITDLQVWKEDKMGSSVAETFPIQSAFNAKGITIPSGDVGIGTTAPSYKLHVNGNFYADTVNTGLGNYELYAMNQNVRTTDAVTFATVNTGQGANELYAMNQNVRTTDAVTFATIDTGSGAKELGDASITDGDTNSIPTNDQVYDFVASYVGSGGTGDVYVNEAGDTMTGNLDMNGNKIINVNKLHATSMGI
ncbi:MAG: hypothetical protein PWQ28_836, partial [Candidatus Woesearchaeota archaeon]|nr:hypothetical protein [Candidatus Woesearchaeota archaeon]